MGRDPCIPLRPLRSATTHACRVSVYPLVPCEVRRLPCSFAPTLVRFRTRSCFPQRQTVSGVWRCSPALSSLLQGLTNANASGVVTKMWLGGHLRVVRPISISTVVRVEVRIRPFLLLAGHQASGPIGEYIFHIAFAWQPGRRRHVGEQDRGNG